MYRRFPKLKGIAGGMSAGEAEIRDGERFRFGASVGGF